MGKMSSLYTAFSGLKAAQAGLYVTGHNMANAETVGYVRQQTLQKDHSYRYIGNSGVGSMQVGLGTDIYGIRQIRDIFLDMSYRREASKLGFHETKAAVGQELEVIIGELQSEYRMEAIISDVWDAINELSIYQPGLETRGNFLSTCVTFLNKANNVYDRMFDYMQNLDSQIRGMVDEINTKLNRINELNTLISTGEVMGDRANDYRDERNLLLDQLSLLIPIEYNEVNKQIKITTEGNELLANGFVTHIGLKYCTGNYSFVEPIFTESTTILPASTPSINYKPLFNLTGSVDSTNGNDNGQLKALLVCRGYAPANYASEAIEPNPGDYTNGKDDAAYKNDYTFYLKMKFNEENAFIPTMMKEFDTIVNSIIEMINNAVSPKKLKNPNNPDAGYEKADDDNAPFGLDGSQFEEVFSRRYKDRFDSNGDYIAEDPSDYYSLYTIGNIILNPVFEDPAGYNKLALSISGDVEDTRLVIEKLLNGWNEKRVTLSDGKMLTINEAYQTFVNHLSVETNTSVSYSDSQMSLITEIDGKRMMISGVSLDEEMERMMIFNHAFNAASRITNVIDGMIDRVINSMGRVGM